MRRVAIVTVVVLLTVTLLIVTWRLRTILVLFIASLVIAATAHGPVERLAARRWPRGWALALVYSVGLVSLLAVLAACALSMAQEFEPLVRELTGLYGQAQADLLAASGTRPTFVSRFPSGEQVIALLLSSGDTLRQAVGATQVIAGFLGQAALAIVLAVYWSADQLRFERLWLSLLDPEHRVYTRTIWREIEVNVGAYIRSELLQSLLAGLLFVVGFWLLDVKYPATAAIVAALAWLAPLVGGLIGLALVVLLGWLSSPTVALVAGLYTLAVYLLLEFGVEQRLFRRPRYWGVVVILVMLAMGSAFGVMGLLAAPPLAVAIQIILDALLGREGGSSVPVMIDASEMHARLARLQTWLAEAEEKPLRLANLVDQLALLVHEVDHLPASAALRPSEPVADQR